MAAFDITTEQFKSLKGQVIIITGASSGIGLATTKLLLEAGASIVAGDLNPVPIDHPCLTFRKMDITSWDDQVNLFQDAERSHGKINHVFANAGVAGRTLFIEDETDVAGVPQKPDLSVLDINLNGTIYTTHLAFHYLRKHNQGSIVVTASTSSYQQFPLADYTVSKHGVLGIMRGMVPNLVARYPSIRINAIAPSWTETGLVKRDIIESTGMIVQGPEVPAKSVALLMADVKRQGQLVYSAGGKFLEIEDALLLKIIRDSLQKYQPEEDAGMARLLYNGN